MLKFSRFVFVLIALSWLSPTSSQQDIKSYLQEFFSGYAYQFAYGSGISSNSPRVELVIHYCRSKNYYSSGRSCRPNIIAKGYQCSNIQDSGVWQIGAQNGQGVLQWMSNTSGPGSVYLQVRTDGTVVDPQGNPFIRIGPAQC